MPDSVIDPNNADSVIDPNNGKGGNMQAFALAVSASIMFAAILSGSSHDSHNAYAAETTIPNFNFGAAGDWGIGSDSTMTAQNMADHDVEIALGLGDYAYSTGTEAVDRWRDEVMAPVQVKFKGALGNHDVSDKNIYAQLSGQSKWVYSFNYQNVHFIAIDSNGSYNPGSSQYELINNDLAQAALNSSIGWIIVYFHHPVYTSPGSHGSLSDLRDSYHPLFDKYGVDLVLQGHNHHYQRTYPLWYNPASPSEPTIRDTHKNTYNDPDGAIYAIVGTGGQSLYSLSDQSSFVVTQFTNSFGFLDVEIINDGKTLEATFYTNGGTIKDSFSINKSPAPKPVSSPLSSPYNYGPYLSLDGSEYRELPNTEALQMIRFSVAAWFKTSETDIERAFFVGGLGSEETGWNLNYGIWMTSSGRIAGGYETKLGSDRFVWSPIPYNDGQWHYAVLTYGGYYAKLYIDGQLVSEKATRAVPDDSGTRPLRIGANNILENNYFTGNIDELRIWSRVLEAEEVSIAYSNGIFDTTGQETYMSFDSEIELDLLQLAFSRDPLTPLMIGHTEPDVIKVGNTFYMYYRNDATAGASINVMSSSDGVKWNEQGTVLTKSASGWDSAEVIAPSVYYDGSTYYLYYEADNESAPGKRAIGVATATSPTGPFTKYSGNPVLKSTLPWEGVTASGYGIVGTPAIMKGDNGKFYLFYHGYRDGADKVGVAYSSSPLGPWSKEANNPILDKGSSGAWDDGKVAPSSVYLDSNSRIILFYEGWDGIKEHIWHWRIGMADGVIDGVDGRIKSLTKRATPALNLGPAGSWDDTTVQLPSVIRVGDELWMYYSGNDENGFRLGRAVAQIP